MALTVLGYCDRLSAQPGDNVTVYASADGSPETIQVDVVRLPSGEVVLPLGAAEARYQPLSTGSWAEIEGLPNTTLFDASVTIWPTAPGRGRQAVLGTWTPQTEMGWGIHLDEAGAPTVVVGQHDLSTGVPLRQREWVTLTASYDGATGELRINDTAVVVTPGRLADAPTTLRIGGPGFNGKIETPRVNDMAWDFSLGIGTTTVHGVAGAPDGVTHELPTRAVTGSNWTGEEHNWRHRPEHYAAIHFHDDDLYDAGWEPTLAFDVPADLPSGVYGVRLTHGSSVDVVPLFVTAVRASTDVAFLGATATYIAYANDRAQLRGGLIYPQPDTLSPAEQYLLEHPEVGVGCYDRHSDFSGVAFSSHLRPVLNMRPDSQLWSLRADLEVVAWLDQVSSPYDVVTDGELHADGVAALEGYRVLVTGTHPEYWTTEMLDALTEWLAGGGRLMYLGGNGFYWRTAFHPTLPGVLEVRRAEGGTRPWIAEAGEYYHEFTGEYGGLWRRIGRPPNRVCGIGFAGQGFEHSTYYRLTKARHDHRVAWAFDGVVAPDDIIGDHGSAGGGAAGQEIDRYDERLGSPSHALVLASTEGFDHTMTRTIEELLSTVPPFDDPKIRSDVTFYETPAGGAVFSVGSIAWAAALATNAYDNDVARLTNNVLHRFADATLFRWPD